MTTRLTTDSIQQEAQLLDEAERQAQQVRQTTLVHPDMTIDDAYAIQDEWLRIRLARGETLVGHKIGLTSRAMQAAMQIETPDSGFLTDAMVFAPDSTLRAADFCDPKLEVELAFVLKDDLSGANLTVDDVLAATDRIVPAIELIAARSHRRDPDTNRARTVLDTIADNAANAGIILGESAIDPSAHDLRWVSALAFRNDIIEETGVAAGVLNHPARGIMWLAERYAQHDMHLEAGHIVLSGSFTRPIDIRAGDNFHFDYGPHGSFGLAFA